MGYHHPGAQDHPGERSSAWNDITQGSFIRSHVAADPPTTNLMVHLLTASWNSKIIPPAVTRSHPAKLSSYSLPVLMPMHLAKKKLIWSKITLCAHVIA